MKTTKLLIICLLLAGLSVQAQKYYVRAGVGIAVSTSASYNGNNTVATGTNTTEVKKGGLGTGLPIVLAGGYRLSDNFWIELGVDYFYGFNIKTENKNFDATSTYKWHAQMLSIVPAIVFTVPLDKFQPYARMGLKVGVMNNIIYVDHLETTIIEKATTSATDRTSKDHGGVAFGVQAAAGTDYNISDLFSIFAEIQVDGISFAPKHGKYTKYSQAGVDVLGDMTTKQKTWDYEKKIDYNETISDDQPSKYTKYNAYLNNVGLVVGVKLKFGK